MGQCVTQFCQQQDQMILSSGLGIDSSTKSPQQIYNQGNARQKDHARTSKGDRQQNDGDESDEEEMQLTQMIMELNGISQNIQNIVNQRYNMDIQSISMIEQAQVSYISKAQNLDMDQEFSNNYFLSEQLMTSNKNPDDISNHLLHKRNSNSNYLSHMIQSFASGGIDGSPQSANQRQLQKQQQQQQQASALNKKQKPKKKRQFLVFRLPRTQYLLPKLEVIPSLNAQEIQDIYFLKDLYDLQKIVSSNLIINFPSKRRTSTSQFFQQNMQDKVNNMNGMNNYNNNHHHSLFFKKLKIVMNEVLMSDLSFLSTLEQWSQIQKLSIHIQSAANTDYLGMLLLRFKDIYELTLRLDVNFSPTSDFLTALCQLINLQKLKLVFNNIFFDNFETSRNFYERLLCCLIGKAFPERYYQPQSTTAVSLSSISKTVQQQQSQQYIPQIISLTSLKFQFIHTDCTPVIDLLLSKVLKGISMPMLNKITMRLIAVQDVANYQVQMLSYFFQTCQQQGNQSAINMSKIKIINFGVQVTFSDHLNLDNHTARFNLSVSNQLDDEFFATKTSTNMNPLNSVTDISPSQTYRIGLHKKTLIEEAQSTQLNQYQIAQSTSTFNVHSHRFTSNAGQEMQVSLSNFSPQMSFNLTSPNGIYSPLTLVGSGNDAKQQLSKNYIAGFLKSFDIKKTRKVVMRDETGHNNFNSNISTLRGAQNLVYLNLQFNLTTEPQFQSLIALMQSNSSSIKRLQLEIEKKILISLYDDHKLFAIISKMPNLISFTANYKTKEPLFNQIISAPNLIHFCEYKNVFNQSPVKQAMRQYTRQVTQNTSLFIKNIGQAKNLLHIQSPDFVQLIPYSKLKSQNGQNTQQINELLFQDIILIKLLKQVKKKLAMCYISIHPSLKQFYSSNAQINTLECSITLQPPLISQNQFLLDISQFY